MMSMQNYNPFKKLNYWLVFLLAACFLFWVPNLLSSYLLHVVILILYFSFMGSAWNIVSGYAGQFSFGHSAFFGVGAYLSSLLYIKSGISPWIGMLVGGILAAGLGGFIGYLTFRYKLKGAFFALSTFAFSEMLRIIALNWTVTGKAMGILIPLRREGSFQDFQFVNKLPYYRIILFMVILVLVVSYSLDHSKLGYYFKAIREDEEAAGSLGINILKYKTIALVMSAFFAALGGTFYAQYMFYIDPDITFGTNVTIEMILRTMLGGVGTVFGPLIGSAVLESIAEVMRSFLGKYKGVYIMFYAAVLILVMIFFPHGLMGLVRKRRRETSPNITK
jgi:branched-chain amino acid transport system permease protein